MPADFGLLQTPNFAQAALAGYQAGQQIGQQRRLDAALAQADLTKPETLMGVLRADPSTGSALLSASSNLAKAHQEQVSRDATSAGLLSALGLNASPPSESPVMAGQAAAAATIDPNQTTPGSPTDANGDVVVTGNRGFSPQQQAQVNWIKADPEGYISAQTAIGKMNEVQRKNLDDANDFFGGAIEAARNMPYEQRKAYIASQRSTLIQHGVPEDRIDSFDPTDANISAVEGQVLGVKGLIDKQDKDRSFGLQRDKFEHDVSQDAATLAVSRGNLGVAQGNLALSRQRESREAAHQAAGGSSSGSGGGGGAPRYEYRTVNGKVQRRLMK